MPRKSKPRRLPASPDAKLERVAAQLQEAAKALIDAAGQLLEIRAAMRAAPAAEAPKRGRSGLYEHLDVILRERPGGATVAELIREVQRRGLGKKYANLRAIVYMSLYKRPELFRQVSRGHWQSTIFDK